MSRFLSGCILALFLPLTTAFANVTPDVEPVQAKLVAEEQAVQPGRPFWVGVELKMAEGWDTYWQNPGDVGFPTTINWHLPEGFEAGPVQWPHPEKLESDGMVVYGYTNSVLLMTEITPSKSVAPGAQANISADVSWLACKDACMPGSAHLDLSLPVQAATPEKDGSVAEAFAQARLLLPKAVNTDELSVAEQAEEIVMRFNLGEIEEALFIPAESELIDSGAPQVLTKGEEGYTLNVKRASGGATPPLKGVLVVSEKGKTRAISVDVAGPLGVTSDKLSSLWVALGLAFVGGLILNVMPCVLPVIALKIFGFVKMAHQRRSLILKHGGVFAMGVVASFWILAGALLILRAYGEQIGWGFQLQEPVFVVVLIGILFLLGLSLFGLFEMGTSLIALGSKGKVDSSPLGSSFMSGVLATLVATPCTGPLLGPALGFAMTLPPVMALLIFTSMGLGMASPYLLFSAFPNLVRFLPKPGNWMIVFKQLMGFVMMATVVWLIWVFGAQTDAMAVTVLLGALLVIAVGAWIFGRWTTPARRKLTRVVGTVVAACFLVAGGAGAIRTAQVYKDSGPALAQHAEGPWLAYSPQKVDELRKEGKAVFVDFTAKWCLTCQVNKVALHTPEVEAAFAEQNVVPMIADWTKRDAVITEELAKLGRSGVPVYVLYPADRSQGPIILPQTLTANVVLDYLGKVHPTMVHAD